MPNCSNITKSISMTNEYISLEYYIFKHSVTTNRVKIKFYAHLLGEFKLNNSKVNPYTTYNLATFKYYQNGQLEAYIVYIEYELFNN